MMVITDVINVFTGIPHLRARKKMCIFPFTAPARGQYHIHPSFYEYFMTQQNSER